MPLHRFIGKGLALAPKTDPEGRVAQHEHLSLAPRFLQTPELSTHKWTCPMLVWYIADLPAPLQCSALIDALFFIAADCERASLAPGFGLNAVGSSSDVDPPIFHLRARMRKSSRRHSRWLHGHSIPSRAGRRSLRRRTPCMPRSCCPLRDCSRRK